MKLLKIAGLSLICGSLLIGQTSCSTMTTTTKGTLIGGGGGAVLGAGIGGLIGGGKGAAIGSAIGAGIGAGTGYLVGQKMQKQQAELQKELGNQAKVEQTTDQNGLQAIKVTFDGGILFASGKSNLSEQAKADLARFAQSLNQNPDTNVQIFGFTDNTGTLQVNQEVSTARANAVLAYLVSCGVAPQRMTAQGIPMSDYVASNDTAAGRAQNRRVEIYITANQNMIDQAAQQAAQ